MAERNENLPAYMRLLAPDALARIHRLELVARGVVEGFVTGRHRSPYKGLSSEFAEHREYVPGDNVRDLDWRVFGRSDRYYIKQYVEETNLRATILVDASGSMKYAGARAAVQDGRMLSKFDYARFLAASLAHLLLHQQDAVGMVTFDKAVRRYLPPRGRSTHLRVLLEELTDTEPGEETDLAAVFHDIAEKVRARGLVIILSDLFGDPGEILKALQHFRFRKHEVIVFHILAEEEAAFPFDRWSQFIDMESSGRSLQIDPRAIRAAYLTEFRKFVETIEKGCGRMHVDYVQMSTRRPFEIALTQYLSRRQALARIGVRGGGGMASAVTA